MVSTSLASLPHTTWIEVDQLSLVKPVRRLHHRVVEGITDRADRALQLCLDQSVGERQRRVLSVGVRVVDYTGGGEVHLRAPAGKQGVFQGHEHHAGVHHGGHDPAEDVNTHPR